MSNASESLKHYTDRYFLNGCGSCTYVFNSTDGCYHRERISCNSGCTCGPLICGVTAGLLKLMHPASVSNAVGVAWSCSPPSEEADGDARVIFGLLTNLASALTFWRRVAIGLGIISALLMAGLVFAFLR